MRRPFLPITLAFLAEILLAHRAGAGVGPWAAGCGLAALWVLAGRGGRGRGSSGRPGSGAAPYLVLLAAAGGFSYQLRAALVARDPWAGRVGDQGLVWFTGTVAEPVAWDPGRQRLVVRVERVAALSGEAGGELPCRASGEGGSPSEGGGVSLLRFLFPAHAGGVGHKVILELPGPPPWQEPGARPGYGTRVVAVGQLRALAGARNPGDFSYRSYLARRGIHRRVSGLRCLAAVGPGPAHPLVALAERSRNALMRGLTAAVGPETAGLLGGLLFGLRGALGEEREERLQEAGLGHLLAVSGLHVGLLAGVLEAGLGAAGIGGGLRIALLLSSLLLYSGLAAFQPSVLRATIMVACVLAGERGGRAADGLNHLSGAAFFLLGSSPFLAFDTGFRLSVLAVASLVWLGLPLASAGAARWEALARRLPGQLGAVAGAAPVRGLAARGARAVSLSLAAQLGVLPVLVPWVGKLNLVSVPANLVALPLVAVLLPAGLLASLAGLLVPGAALPLLEPLLAAPVEALGRVATWAAAFSFGPGPGTPPLPWAVGAGGLVLAEGWWLRRPGQLGPHADRPGLLLCLALFAVPVGFLAGDLAALAPFGSGELLRVVVLAVGDGQAVLIRSPAGRHLLLDGGGGSPGLPGRSPAAGRDVVVPALRALGVRRLDAVILSHPHRDHLAGLLSVVATFPVGAVVDGAAGLAESLRAEDEEDAELYQSFRRLLVARGVAAVAVRAGDRLDLGDGARLLFLHPPGRLGFPFEPGWNSHSLVARLEFGRFSMLFLADIGWKEGRLLAARRGAALSSTVLLLPHHGAAASFDRSFLAAVAPRWAIASSGEGYGHPAPIWEAWARERGVRLLRTSREGAVVVETDGRRVRVSSWAARRPEAGREGAIPRWEKIGSGANADG